MRPLAHSRNPSSLLSAYSLSSSASQPSANSLTRIVTCVGPTSVFHPNTLRPFSNSNTNIPTPRINDDSLLSQILSNQKKQQGEQRKWKWIEFGFSAVVVATTCFYVHSQRQQHNQVNQQLQQRLQQEQNFSGLKISVLDAMLSNVVKRLSARSGESEEAIMSSVAQEVLVHQTTTVVTKE